MSFSADFYHLIAIYMLVLIAPGLDFAVVLRESLLYGRGHGLMAACGVMSAVAVHCTYTILGLGLIIAQSLLLFQLIKWAGIVYLLYIGLKALRGKSGSSAIMAQAEAKCRPARAKRQAFKAGFICNLLNPKCILFFLSIFSALIASATPMGIKALIAPAMVLCCGLWFACVAFFLTMPKITFIYRRLGRWIDKTSGVVFVAIGMSLILQKAPA
ncbi:LysE family translocator [Candidatus Tokpelaia sp.]|uniref:LysE family translocator n=1 Tax=Candidatus Tokpelaia sp. TaxID=2233777 RepID=UPI001239FB4A|nr:LysE family transporter [Candidatus Tokpelaia sp.]KAA6406071.1 LysE family translocator [Candidatus Tokpelaia sp.]